LQSQSTLSWGTEHSLQIFVVPVINGSKEGKSVMSHDLVVSNQPEHVTVHYDMRTDLEPRSIVEAMRVAAIVAKTGMYGVRTPEEAFIRIATGKELGLTAMQSLRGIYIINGRGRLDASLMVALVKRHPACEYFKLVESTDKIATYSTSRKNEGVTTMSYTIEQAARAKLLAKESWRNFPEAMLRARAASALAVAVYPDQLNGLSPLEESDDSNSSHHKASVVPELRSQANHTNQESGQHPTQSHVSHEVSEPEVEPEAEAVPPFAEESGPVAVRDDNNDDDDIDSVEEEKVSVFQYLRDSIANAKDKDDLERVTIEVRKAYEEEGISKEERGELLTTYRARATTLGVSGKKGNARSSSRSSKKNSPNESTEEDAA
jgi:hypothetical protein